MWQLHLTETGLDFRTGIKLTCGVIIVILNGGSDDSNIAAHIILSEEGQKVSIRVEVTNVPDENILQLVFTCSRSIIIDDLVTREIRRKKTKPVKRTPTIQIQLLKA